MAARKWIGFRTGCALVILVVAGATWLVGLAAQRVLALRMGTVHTYTLPSPPRFLTDQLALQKAQQSLASEGYNTEYWKAVEDSKSSDPDGNHDKYLARNPANSASGTIIFCDSDKRTAKHTRIVHVELKGNRVDCQVEMPK
jgi:hypothetical protein